MKKVVLFGLFSLFMLSVQSQTTVDFISSRDNTMYEESPSNSNGAGDHMFTGVTDNGDIRRALLYFDVAANVPAGATITNVTLTLNMSRTIVGSQTVNLHRLTKDWGEAGSNAPGQEGQGTSAQNNDATWNENFYNSSSWTNPGANGDYNTTASASQTINNLGSYTWSSAQLISDVQNMLDNPGSNYGWIIIGNESTSPTAKRFDTHENPTASNRPELSVTYTMPPSAQDLVINEVDYDQAGTDNAEFIELRNNDNSAIDLSNYEIELVNGSNGSVYQTISLPSVSLEPDSFFVVCAAGSGVPNCDLEVSPSTNLIQNGSPDAIGLKFNGTTVIDAVSYEGNTAAPYTETSGVGLEDNSSIDDSGISRIPDGTDTDVNNVDFSFTCNTPGLRNGGPITSFNITGSNGFCPGEMVLLKVSGDNANPQWYRNGSPITGAMDTFYNATEAGIYNVMTDHGSCRDSANTGITLFEFTPPSVDLGPDTTVCQSYLLDAGNPGASYDWNTGQTSRIIQVSSSGTYSVTVTDNNGCEGTDTVNVTIGTTFDFSLEDTTQGCDSVTLDAGLIAGATYLWNTGETTSSITVSAAGKYWVDIERNGCESSDTTYAKINPTPTVDLGKDTSTCDSIQLAPTVTNATNPTYTWSTGDNTPSITVDGTSSIGNTFMVTVTSEGCKATDTINVNFLPTPDVDLGNDFQACNQTTLDAGKPGATYSWNTGAVTDTILVTSSGEYSVTVTNPEGCSASDTVNVTINPSLNVDLGPDQTVCDSTTLRVNIPNAIYTWNTTETTQEITVNSTGEYAVTVAQNGCTGEDTVNITVNQSPTVDLGADIVACDSATLDAGSQTGTITWFDGSSGQTVTVTTSGSYSVTVEENNCIATDTIEVTINQTPVVDLGADIEACGTATLDAGNPNATFIWSTGESSQTISVTNSDTYSVTVTENGCSNVDSIEVTINPLPIFTLGPDIEACEIATLSSPVFAGNEWSTGETSSAIQVTSSGNYSLTITDGNGCSYADTINVTIHPNPDVNLGADMDSCDQATITAPAADDYNWSTGASTQSIVVTQSGSYSVTITDANGCQGADTIDVNIKSAPTANFGFDLTNCPLVAFSDSSEGDIDNWMWEFGDDSTSADQNPTHEYDVNGDYTVSLTVSNECGSNQMAEILDINCITGISSFEAYFSVYPNPASNRFVLSTTDGSFIGATIQITTLNGQVMKATKLTDLTSQIQIGTLSAGNYLLIITNGDTQFSKKIVVTK